MQEVDIFLFINPKSGAKMGRKMLEKEYEMVQVNLNQNILARVHLIDLTNSAKKLRAFKDIIKIQKRKNE
jgi:hypothetical protein